MGFSEKEVGRMTIKKWKQMYDAYKLVFDVENSLIRNGERYSNVDVEATIDDVIPY